MLAFVFVSQPVQAGTCAPYDTTPDFTDFCYHEYVLYNVDQSDIDILILPSASPYAARDAVLMEESVEMWDDGINNLGPTWLASGVNLNHYTVGLDTIPENALWDAEIVIIPAEFNPAVLFGIGLQSPSGLCHGIPNPLGMLSAQDGFGLADFYEGTITAQDMAAMPEFHQHDGPWGMLTTKCANGGYTCFVINTNFLWLPDNANGIDMFDLNSHELGHCLGIGHVGDALDFTANAYPRDDIMSYESDGWNPNYVLCVSTLNIRALERVYGHMLSQPGYPAFPANSYVHMVPSDWSDDGCTATIPNVLDVSRVTSSDTVQSVPTDTGCIVDAAMGPIIDIPTAILAC
jgi:hypothetical protein